METKHIPSLGKSHLLLFALLFVFSFGANADVPKLPAKISVVVDSLNVRDNPPWFSWKTIFTGKYVLNPAIDVLKNGQIATAIKKEIVGNGKLWLEITYKKNGSEESGWVYAGQENNIVNIMFDEKSARDNFTKHSREASKSSTFSFVDLFIGSALADGGAVSVGSAQVDADIEAKSSQRVIVLLVYVVTFIASLLVTYKITNNGFLSFFSGLGVLLILGFITPELFSTMLNIHKS